MTGQQQPPVTLESLTFDWGDAYERHEVPLTERR